MSTEDTWVEVPAIALSVFELSGADLAGGPFFGLHFQSSLDPLNHAVLVSALYRASALTGDDHPALVLTILQTYSAILGADFPPPLSFDVADNGLLHGIHGSYSGLGLDE